MPLPNKYKHTPEEIRKTLRDLKGIYKSGNEVDFMKVLRKNGIRDEDPRFAALVKLFRELRSGKT
jgi:hypothetical protein